MFSFDNGLNLAVAFTAYDNEEEPILDESYGQLVFNAYGWGPNEQTGLFETKREVLKTRACTQEELGLEGQNGKFFNETKGDVEQLRVYRKKFVCIDEADLMISGDFTSAKARQLNVQLVKCHEKPFCKSDEEILKFFRDKWLLTLHNEITFNVKNIGANAI